MSEGLDCGVEAKGTVLKTYILPVSQSAVNIVDNFSNEGEGRLAFDKMRHSFSKMLGLYATWSLLRTGRSLRLSFKDRFYQNFIYLP